MFDGFADETRITDLSYCAADVLCVISGLQTPRRSAVVGMHLLRPAIPLLLLLLRLHYPASLSSDRTM